MRENRVRERLARGESVLGCAISLGAPIAGELLSRAGFDFVMVDMQHGAFEDESAMAAFRSICYGPATPFIRVQKNDYATIGRALDRGALGIVVPMVNTVEDARAAAHAVRFPPRGGRSIGPFGTTFLGDDYVAEVDDQVYLAVQIESKTGVENAEEILSVEGVDGCWCGPGDMGLSMGCEPARPERQPEVEAALLSVLEVCQRLGKIPGIASIPDTTQYWLDKGFRYVTVGAETTLLNIIAAEVLRDLGRAVA